MLVDRLASQRNHVNRYIAIRNCMLMLFYIAITARPKSSVGVVRRLLVVLYLMIACVDPVPTDKYCELFGKVWFMRPNSYSVPFPCRPAYYPR